MRRALNLQVLELASSQALADHSVLHIVHAWEAVGESAMRGSFMRSSEEEVRAYIDSTRQQREAEMDRLVSQLVERPGGQAMQYLEPEIHLVKGRVRNVIPSLASQLEADLVVMGTVARTGVLSPFALAAARVSEAGWAFSHPSYASCPKERNDNIDPACGPFPAFRPASPC